MIRVGLGALPSKEPAAALAAVAASRTVAAAVTAADTAAAASAPWESVRVRIHGLGITPLHVIHRVSVRIHWGQG